MAEWKGKSRGNVLGYKIFVFAMRHLGLGFAYFLLRFVALYFWLFARQGRLAMYTYFRRRWGYSKFKSAIKVYQNYYVFGQTLIDRIAIMSGLDDKFTYEFDGIENLKALLAQKKGGILISGHIGNFDISDFFFQELDVEARINLAVTDLERQDIKSYLESVKKKTDLKFIILKDDMSHIFDIHRALSNNEIICFTGDRHVDGIKTLDEELLGKKASFPAGPFHLAARMKVPVIFVYVMKESKTHYHLYARTAQVEKNEAQVLLKKYTENMEWILEKYPLQWFNYFDYWKELK